MRLRNWIPDRNPFQLAAPPAGFLLDLWCYDARLVIIPSRQEPVYRLTRRRVHTPGVGREKLSHPKVKDFDPAPDTQMMAFYDVVPVTTIFPPSAGAILYTTDRDGKMLQGVPATEVFTPRLIAELALRDVQRVGGGVAASKLLDDRDDRTRQRQDDRLRADTRVMLGDVYRRYAYGTGARTSLAYAERRRQPSLSQGVPGPLISTGRTPTGTAAEA